MSVSFSLALLDVMLNLYARDDTSGGLHLNWTVRV
jgi:hypothetical protein